MDRGCRTAPGEDDTDVDGAVGRSADAAAGVLGSPVRRAVADTLAGLRSPQRQEGLTAVELGELLDLHPTTIRFHVDQLLAAGVLEANYQRSGGVGRPRKRYLLREVPLGESRAESGDAPPFQLLAGVLASALSGQEADRLTPEEAGIRWAQSRAEGTGVPHEDDPTATVEHVVGLLGDWGYSPEVEPQPDGEVEVVLADCPFVDLAATHPDVVCGLHRGLLRGALDSVGQDAAQVSLRPFVTPTTCRASIRLAHREEGRP